MRNIAITGAGGRMGKALIEALAATDGVQLTAAIEHSASQHAVSYTHLTLPTNREV